MKSYKNYLKEAFNKKPQTENELKDMLKQANMSDWFPFLKLVWDGFSKADKNLMSFQFNKLAKGKNVSGQTLGLKIQPGTFYLLTMDAGAEKLWKKKWPGLNIKLNDSGAEPKLELSKTMKHDDGEMYDYSLDLISGLGSGAKKGPDGAQWESVITYHVNNELGKPNADPAAKEVHEEFIDYAPQGQALAKAFVKELGIKTVMKQFGKGSGTTSKIWKERGASNTTPKTDMYTGNYNISLKKDGGSQLASGTAAETLAMFDAALSLWGKQGGAVIKDIMNDINDKFTKVTIEFNKTEMASITTGGKVRGTSVNKKGKLAKDGVELPKEKQDALKSYTETEAFHKAFNVELEDTFEKVTKHQEFLKWFCFEAMSGYIKFKDQELPRASTCITFNPDKATVERVDITPNGTAKGLGGNPKVGADLTKKSKSVKLYAAWKSSGKNPYSSLRVAFKKHKNEVIVDKNESVDVNCTIDSIIREQILLDEDVKSLGLNLTEDIVQLDEFALIKSLWKKMKDVGKNASKWINGLFSKVFAQVKKVLSAIAKLGEKMFQVLFNFLGIEPTKVTTSVPSDIEYFFNK